MTTPAATIFHYPMACSLASVIAAKVLNVPLQVEHVDVYSKEILSGGSLFTLNPLGQVATLKLRDGSILTQNVAILHWIHRASNEQLTQSDEHQLISWLTFCATEIHKGLLWVTMRSDTTDDQKNAARERIRPILHYTNTVLSNQKFLLGDIFSVADCYLFWTLFLAPRAGVALDAYPELENYQNRLSKRPAFIAAVAQDRSDFAIIKARYPSTEIQTNPALLPD